MLKTGLVAIAAIAVSMGCSSARPTSDSRGGDPTDPLLGAWRSEPVYPTGSSAPCPLLLEVFADGSVEVNWLNDDSDAKMCSASRLALRRETIDDKPTLRMGGQLSTCLYRLAGNELWLACEDHDRPPPDLSLSIQLHRIPPGERSRLPALVGRWRPPQYWGGNGPGTHFDVTASGEMKGFGDGNNGPDVITNVTDSTFDLLMGRTKTQCRYRATEYRWTFRCFDASRGYPQTLWDPQASEPDNAMVLVRVVP